MAEDEVEVGSPEYERCTDALMAARLNEVYDRDPFVGGRVLEVDGVWRVIEVPEAETQPEETDGPRRFWVTPP